MPTTTEYSVAHIPIMSFFSRSLYRDLAFRWKGTGFAYLLLLLAVCTLFSAINCHIDLVHFVDHLAPPVISQVPTIKITNGEVTVYKPQPYYITVPRSGRILAVLDTTGTIRSLDETDAILFLTKSGLIIREGQTGSRTLSFAKVDNFTVDQYKVRGWLNNIKRFFLPVAYPVSVLGSFVVKVIQALIYAAIGLLFAKWCKVELKYASLLRLTVTALTPAIIVKTLLGATSVHLPFAGLWYVLATMGYLVFGVTACAQAEPAAPVSRDIGPVEDAPRWNMPLE